MEIKNYRDLRVWQAGLDLVMEVYELTQEFPKEEMYGLVSQMRRSAVSIPSNIAEGHAREHGKEYLQHVSFSQASLAELETQLEIAKRLGYIPSDKLAEIREHTVSLSKQLYALRNAVARSMVRTPTPNT